MVCAGFSCQQGAVGTDPLSLNYCSHSVRAHRSGVVWLRRRRLYTAQRRSGLPAKIREADGGTLFLDEIPATCPLDFRRYCYGYLKRVQWFP